MSAGRAPIRAALITCRALPEPDFDEAPLLAALAAAGVRAVPVAWDDPTARLGDFDTAVLRSCWNYHEDPAAFARWIDATAAATRLLNPPAALRWNLHKGYLLELERRLVRIVPTALVRADGVAPGAASFAATMAARGWDDAVVKPAISAGSARTRRFARAETAAAQAFLQDNLRRGDMLVQQFQPTVGTHGERSLVWIDGAFTHSIRKEPRFAGQDEAVTPAAIEPADLAFAERVLAAAPLDLAYARVDLMHDADGAPMLSELELLEPSLFFPQCPPAAARFAAMVARRARG
ncbi:MAG: RimK family alpha-L-glutamate ligase [Planctomycetota bacterium]